MLVEELKGALALKQFEKARKLVSLVKLIRPQSSIYSVDDKPVCMHVKMGLVYIFSYSLPPCPPRSVSWLI